MTLYTVVSLLYRSLVRYSCTISCRHLISHWFIWLWLSHFWYSGLNTEEGTHLYVTRTITVASVPVAMPQQRTCTCERWSVESTSAKWTRSWPWLWQMHRKTFFKNTRKVHHMLRGEEAAVMTEILSVAAFQGNWLAVQCASCWQGMSRGRLKVPPSCL